LEEQFKDQDIDKHQHEESIFKFIAQGNLVLNGKHKITSGMWFVVRTNTPYEIYTEEGYVSLSGYTVTAAPEGEAKSHLFN